MHEIDEKDYAILEVLKENSGLSIQKIAKKTGIPIATVHNRIKKLKQEGIIERYTIVIDKAKLGRKMTAHVLIKTTPKSDHIVLLEKIMKHELEKIVQDYSGISLIIYVSADLATQTSLEIAIRKSQSVVSGLKAKEVWFLRNIPVRMIHGKASNPNCHAYQLIKVAPYKHTYGFVFSL